MVDQGDLVLWAYLVSLVSPTLARTVKAMHVRERGSDQAKAQSDREPEETLYLDNPGHTPF